MNLKEVARRVVPSKLWTRLRQISQHRKIARYERRVVRHSYGGIELRILLADGLGAGWYDHDWPELQEIRLLSEHQMRPGARVFDLGAHQGVVALMLAHQVGPNGTVVAVEANAHNFQTATANKELNGAKNLQLIHAAVAESSGSITFNDGLNGQVDDGTGEWGRVIVPAVSVDDLAREYGTPHVLFVDVEGFECHVLRGAEATLRSRPDCFVEVHVRHGLEKFGGSVEAVLSFLPESDYQMFVWSEALSERVPICRAGDLLKDRFFLLALRREGAAT